jgi:polysaccharide biosynthesis transport protein
METANKNSIAGRNRPTGGDQRATLLTPEHCLRLIFHRKWLILGVFGVVTLGTVIVTSRLPNVYTSATLILVDPQKVPENYVKPTVSGDIRNRLGTLQQQILSATRLQKIIDSLNLYPTERKTMSREDVITRMQSAISVSVVGDFGGGQDLEAFRISYSGSDPRLVAQVANEIAAQFIEENLKAREQQAEGTTEFLSNQLEQTRKTLEEQESKLRDFRLKHIGEMPEQEASDLQILGQLQSQLQLEGDALSRAEQQRNYAQSLMSGQPAGVVEMDDGRAPRPAVEENPPGAPAATASGAPVVSASAKERTLAALLARGLKEDHPDVRKLRKEIEIEKKAKEAARADNAVDTSASQQSAQVVLPPPPAPQTPAVPQNAVQRKQPATPPRYVNPVLQTQLTSAEEEIARHKERIQALQRQIAGYQAKLESIPVREQQITALVRDYEISKGHYQQLLNNQLSAETATQLEVRQKGEKFSILDPAQPPASPSRPNRKMLNAGGSLAGLGLGLFLALATEFLGMSITSADHLIAATGLPVLEVIPLIETRVDRLARRKRMFVAAASGAAAAAGVGAILAYHFRSLFF